MAKGNAKPEASTPSGGPKVISCPSPRPSTCKEHPFQDKRYGVGKRLHNRKLNGEYTCTVCGQVRKDSTPKPKKKAEDKPADKKGGKKK